MVEQAVDIGVIVIRRGDKTDRKPPRNEIVLVVAHGRWQGIQDPMDTVVVVDQLPEKLHLLLRVAFGAEFYAGFRYLHFELIRAIGDGVASQNLAQVFHFAATFGGAAEGDIIVFVRDLSFRRSDLVDFQGNLAISNTRRRSGVLSIDD